MFIELVSIEDAGHSLLHNMSYDAALVWTSHLPKNGNNNNDNAGADGECFGCSLPLVKRRRLVVF